MNDYRVTYNGYEWSIEVRYPSNNDWMRDRGFPTLEEALRQLYYYTGRPVVITQVIQPAQGW